MELDHPERINRGYVFSSDHLDPSQAEAELVSRNPKISKTRLVSYRSGRHERMWVDNVVAICNSGAFVEPLEATAIMCLCLQCRWLRKDNHETHEKSRKVNHLKKTASSPKQ